MILMVEQNSHFDQQFLSASNNHPFLFFMDVRRQLSFL